MTRALPTAALLAAIAWTTAAAQPAPKPAPKPRKPTAAELNRVLSQRALIGLWEECLGDELSDSQKAYLETITEYSAQHYLQAVGTDSAECRLVFLKACEHIHPGECIATARERDGRQ